MSTKQAAPCERGKKNTAKQRRMKRELFAIRVSKVTIWRRAWRPPAFDDAVPGEDGEKADN